MERWGFTYKTNLVWYKIRRGWMQWGDEIAPAPLSSVPYRTTPFMPRANGSKTKTSLSLSHEVKMKLAILKSQLRAQGVPATESSILEVLVSHATAAEIAKVHLKRKKRA